MKTIKRLAADLYKTNRMPTPYGEVLLKELTRAALRQRFRIHAGRPLDPQNPTWYTEKVTLRVLKDFHVPFQELTDNKVIAGVFAASLTRYPLRIARLLGAWRYPEPNIIASLPTPFILKSSHGSGINSVVHETGGEEFGDLVSDLARRARHASDAGYRYNGFLIAEELLTDAAGDIPRDLKFHCFHQPDGRFEWILQIDADRFIDHRQDLFDRRLQRLPFSFGDHRASPGEVPLPANLDDFVAVARDLSRPFGTIRIDLYDMSGHVVFGEFTPAHGGGSLWIHPSDHEETMGELWQEGPQVARREIDAAADGAPSVVTGRVVGVESSWSPRSPKDGLRKSVLEIRRRRRANTLLQEEFTRRHRRSPRSGSPSGFTEKVITRALSPNSPPLYEVTADLLSSGLFAVSRAPQIRLRPRLGVWEHVRAEDLSGLPRPFLLRPNYGEFGGILVTDAEGPQLGAIAARCNDELARARCRRGGEFQRFLLAEEESAPDGDGPNFGLKIHCFHRPDRSFDWIAQLRVTAQPTAPTWLRRASSDWNSLSGLHDRLSNDFPAEGELEQLVDVAARVSGVYDYARVDFSWNTRDFIFDRITLLPLVGLRMMLPDDLDHDFGRMWHWAPDGYLG